MRTKIALMAATALGLVAGAAHAGDGNQSHVDQNGSGNQASVTQSGNDNEAGSSGQKMRQSQLRNLLTIVQSGNGNDIGLGTNANGGSNHGIYQVSNRPGTQGNRLAITQSSDGNEVGAVLQNSGGTPTNINFNSVNITQGGSGGHRIGSITQSRNTSSAHRADILQTGSDNTIERIYQRTTLGGNGTNRIEVEMSGSDNGNGLLSGFAAGSGAQTSVLIQGDATAQARGNFARLEISGSTNEFGTSQYGQSNTVGTISISGNSNQIGAYQSSVPNVWNPPPPPTPFSANVITIAAITGSFNNIGIRQVGEGNSSSADIVGNGNQTGLEQNGADNIATLVVTGNNNGGGTLAGAAGILAGNTGSANGHSPLTSGQIVQDGIANDASLTISLSDGNQFALLQEGDDNTIVGTVTGTGSNSVAVVQIGDLNTSNFNQNGSGNVAAISQ